MRSRFLSKSYEQDLISSKVQILHEMPTGKLGHSIDMNNFPGLASTTEEFSTGGIEEGSMQVGHPEQDFVFSISKMIHDRFMQETLDYGFAQLGSGLYGERDERFGNSVALANGGNRVAIGAYWSQEHRGTVRIYDYMNNGWQMVGEMVGDASDDNFGWKVALSNDGNRLAIGAPLHDSAKGHVRIYNYIGNNDWEQLGSDIDGENYGDKSGQSVSLSNDGNRVAIGAHGNSGTAYASGHARIYEYTSNNVWEQLGSDIDGDVQTDLFGWSVSLSKDGKRVAIGARRDQRKE